MKTLVITALMLFTFTVGTNAQEIKREFTPEEQAIVDLSNNKWNWMSEKNVEKLAELFHENSQFVHMGGYWGKKEELNTIRTGNIWYKKAEIHDVQVKFAGGTATVYSRIHLNSVVGGNAVRFPFIVTEVYVMEKRKMATFITLFYENFGRLIKHKTEHENQEFLFHCAFYIVLCNIFCTDRRRL